MPSHQANLVRDHHNNNGPSLARQQAVRSTKKPTASLNLPSSPSRYPIGVAFINTPCDTTIGRRVERGRGTAAGRLAGQSSGVSHFLSYETAGGPLDALGLGDAPGDDVELKIYGSLCGCESSQRLNLWLEAGPVSSQAGRPTD